MIPSEFYKEQPIHTDAELLPSEEVQESEAEAATQLVVYVPDHETSFDEEAIDLEELGRFTRISQKLGRAAVGTKNWAKTLPSRTANVGRGLGKDIKESGNRLKTGASVVATIGSQAVDRARVSLVLIPEWTLDVYKHTHSAPETGLAAAALTFVWTEFVGETLNQGLSELPHTVEGFQESFPGVVDFFDDSLPGSDLERDKEERAEMGVVKRAGKTFTTHLKRGSAVAGIGTTAYVGTAHGRNKSRSNVSKLTAVSAADGGAFVGGVVGGAAAVVNQIGTSHPNIALDIEKFLSNPELWYAVAGASVVSQVAVNVKKRIAQRKEKADLTQEEAVATALPEEA